ncbi:Rid family hydrolase [Fibrobacterota bacterium]
MYSYHIKHRQGSFAREMLHHDQREGRNGMVINGAHYQMLWTANYAGQGFSDAGKQTDEVFESLATVLGEYNMSLLDNTIRTWVFVRDIDNQYKGMVISRRNFFLKHGFTGKTRYIASTGIEGNAREVNSLISVDAMSLGGLAKDQIVVMEALEHLSPSIKYGVTFERGLKVPFGDRTHLYVSGTASINEKGELLYPGNIRKQTRRALENIKALLTPHGADFADVAHLIVYVRDPKKKSAVEEMLSGYIPERVPCLLVEAPACRPGWLVEIEAMGIKSETHNFPAFL